MTETQKIIKTGAIIFGIFIIIIIVSLILNAISLFLNFDKDYVKGSVDLSISYENVSNIDIDVESTNVEILKGQDFSVEKYDTKESLTVTVEGDTLKIKEKSKYFWHSSLGGKVTVLVPNEVDLEEIRIEMGAGKAELEDIEANYLELNQGAGKVTIKDSSFERTDIDGGTGSIEIKSTVLKNLDMDVGVGKVDIDGQILGNSAIDAGVGALSVDLDGILEDYTIETEKGIGSIKIDGEDASRTNGSGINLIKISGGVGSVDIDFH